MVLDSGRFERPAWLYDVSQRPRAWRWYTSPLVWLVMVSIATIATALPFYVVDTLPIVIGLAIGLGTIAVEVFVLWVHCSGVQD